MRGVFKSHAVSPGESGDRVYLCGGNDRKPGAHAWNIVNCGGNYYQMDVTFADPVFYSGESSGTIPGNVINYDYLCCTDEEIMTDHVADSEVAYPACSMDDLNYYRMNGMYYDSFDVTDPAFCYE